MALPGTVSLLLAALSFTSATPLKPLYSLSSYTPVLTTCPANLTIRPARGQVSAGEAAYFAARKPLADQALLAWLASVDPPFASRITPQTTLPSVGLASSGGGYRALLTGAGVVQGLDERDGPPGAAGRGADVPRGPLGRRLAAVLAGRKQLAARVRARGQAVGPRDPERHP